MTTHRSFAARADIEEILLAREAPRTDIDVLQPADPFLDTAGEELRRRIFMTANESGQPMCLRPEFTIPVCLHHLRQGDGPSRYGYVGTVFRQRRDDSPEFLQAGIEDIGDFDTTNADARSLADALTMVVDLGADTASTRTTLGDQSVFDAVLEALDIPRGWRLRLAHVFGDQDALALQLDALAKPPVMPPLPDDVAAAMSEDPKMLERAVAGHLERAGLLNGGGRKAVEIARRLYALANAASRALDQRRLDVLRSFLALRVPLSEAVSTLDVFCHKHGLVLNGNRDRFAARVSAIRQAGLDCNTITYDASFGRALDYYTGLVFEICNSDGAVLVGGGRYDKLLTLLGAKDEVPGIGFSVWLDRIGRETYK